MAAAGAYEAGASDDSANWLEQRARLTPEASARHLTRRADLLASRLEPPDRSMDPAPAHPAVPETEAAHPREHRTEQPTRVMPPGAVDPSLRDLPRAFLAQHDAARATQAAGQQWSHVAYWARRREGAAPLRRARAPHNRLRQARLPVIKTLEQCRWDWPTQMHRLQGQHHFGRGLLQDRTTRISLGGVG